MPRNSRRSKKYYKISKTIKFPLSSSEDKIADWIELYTLFHYKTLSQEKLFSILREAFGEEPEENLISDVWSVLIYRKKLYGINGPYKIEENKIIPQKKWSEIPTHAMNLIYSNYGVESFNDKGTKLFERYSGEAIKKYLNGNILVLGFPSNKNLAEHVEYIIELLNEEKGTKKPDSRKKDRGVDVIVWKSHGDTRSNNIIILFQCGVGKNWQSKKNIIVDSWRRYVAWAVEPGVGITMPAVISLENWEDKSDEYKLLIDRPRLYRLLVKTKLERNLKTEIVKWCKTRFKEIKN